MPPPAPVIVMGYVPVLVVLAAVSVYLDVPDPGALIDVGLKLPVTPVGRPEPESAIAELNPPETAVVTVTYPFEPRLRDPELGETEMVKAGVAGAVTVRLTVVVSVVPPDVPVTERGYVPGVVVAPTVRVSTEVPVPVSDAGLKPYVTPAGNPVAETANVTDESNPPVTVLVMLVVP